MAYEFMGYVRPDGQVGCRNHVAVMPSVTCAGDVASAIVRQVAGTVGYFHHQGCCQLPPDLDRVTETLISLGKSPNVTAVLVVSLGCGAPQGFPTMPVLKVCGNPNTYERMSHDMDINAGRIITGEKSIEEVGEEAFSAILDLLSGKQTKNETLGYHSSIDIYTLGPVI